MDIVPRYFFFLFFFLTTYKWERKRKKKKKKKKKKTKTHTHFPPIYFSPLDILHFSFSLFFFRSFSFFICLFPIALFALFSLYLVYPRASDWKDQVAVVKVVVVTRGKDVALKLYRTDPDRLFAVCPIRSTGPAGIEPVTDSSRYFCLRIEDGKGNHAFIGR